MDEFSHLNHFKPAFAQPLQEPKLEVSTVYKVR